MRNQKILFVAAALSLVGLLPRTVGAQSGNSSQETQALRKQLDEMRAQMNNLQARLDQLEAAKAEPNRNQPAASAPVSPQRQDGTIQTTRPLPQGPTSPQVGQQTSTYQEYSEDVVAAPRYDNVPTDPSIMDFFICQAHRLC